MDKVANKLTRVISSGSKKITFDANNLAKFSDGACSCSLGDTTVLVTAVSEQGKKTSQNFVPLSVEYKQKAAAAGRIPLTHLRREIGTSELEILTGRMIDRSIRPAFGKAYRTETQIICNLLAVDGNNDADILAINGASASLALSDIPWNGPIGAVRVGLVGDKPIANPSRQEQKQSRLNLVMAANGLGNVVMMDGACREPILQPDIIKAMRFGVKECRAIIDSISKLQKNVGKPKRPLDLSREPTEEQKDFFIKSYGDEVTSLLSTFTYDKISRDQAMNKIREKAYLEAKEKYPDAEVCTFNDCFSYVVRTSYGHLLKDTGVRCDGRQFNELRPIDCKIDLYKPLHGSALFQRGQTQVFCSTTFDSPDAAFRADPLTSLISGVKEKNFMLHYEFPPYATNETGRVGAMPNRREIGHGALAEKALRPMIPESHDMTIRLNCEVMESNGSSSMASVAAGSLSLMDAGVNIKEHCTGVAMGLISHADDLNDSSTDETKYSILTDILGFEDYIGDMDFKIAGTKKFLTAIQLDVKPMNGIPTTILYKAIQRAQTARVEIIQKMDKTIKCARADKKENHPVMKTIHIPVHKVSAFVGFGGANLKKLMAAIGVRVSAYGEADQTELGAEARDNFIIFAPNQEAMNEADEYIKMTLEKTKEPQLDFNGIYTATIQEIRPNGVMVTLYPNMMPALLPLSQLDVRTVSHPSALNLEVGQQLQVKYFGRDPASGHMRLSRKSLQMSNVSRIHRTPLG